MLRLGFDFSKMRTLEIGCGTGTFSLTLNLLGAQTTLLDADENAIAAAKECFSIYGLKAEFITGDVTKPLPESLKSKFDFVISGGLAEHFTGEQRAAVIKYHRQALNNNGFAYIAVPNALSPYYRLVMALMKLAGQWEIETEIPYTPSELIKLAAAAGFADATVIGLIDTKRDIISHALAAGSVILKLLPASASDSLKKMGIYSKLKRMEPVQYKELDLKHFILESTAKVKDSPNQKFLKKGIKDILSSNLVLLGFAKNNG
jgi:2-polyprenyl-3-methyl-5-hydroxy-6-metoxy-1,4-benzoquinol methylase